MLTYGWSDRTLTTYDTAITLTMEFDMDGGDTDDTALTTVMKGRTRIVALADHPTDGQELIADFLLDGGHVEIGGDGASFRVDLTEEDRGDFRNVVSGIAVVDAAAIGTGSLGGSPSSQFAATAPEVLMAFGPPLSVDAVDEGDSWTVTMPDELMGTVRVDVEIVDEFEGADGEYMFVIEYAATADPIDGLDLTDLLKQSRLGGEFAGLLDMAEVVSFDFQALDLAGRGIFDPVRGLMVELETSMELGVEIAMTVDGVEVSGLTTMSQESVMTLTAHEPALSFEVTAILDRLETDPYDLALARLGSVSAYFDAPDGDRLEVIFDELLVYSFPIAGYSVADVKAAGKAATVVVITNRGEFRGYPTLAEDLGYVVSGSDPRRLLIAGQETWRFTAAGHEWLMWNDDQFTYAIVGDGSVAASTMESFITLPPPALWQPGDCLTFADDGNELPFSPFGDYGLIHCSEPHEYEVLYTEYLDDAADASFPDDIGERRSKACGERFFEHTGGYPLTSELGMITYQPDRNEWDKGARYLACIIYQGSPDGPLSMTTRLDGAGAANPVTLEVGTCLSDELPVDCRDPHDLEIIGVGEYDAPEGAPFPNLGGTWEELSAACDPFLDEFGVTDGPAEVEAFGYTDMYLGWDAGLRTYYCVASATADDFNESVTGSFRGEWELAPEQVDA